MEGLFEVVVFLAIATLGAALARRLGLLAPIVLVVLGLALSFVPGFPQVRARPGPGAGRHPAAAALRGRAGDLGAGVPAQPAADPAARGRRWCCSPRSRSALVRAPAAARACRSRSAWPSARWWPRRTRSPPPRSPAGSACPAGWSPSWRARAWSTTPPRWCCCGWRSRGHRRHRPVGVGYVARRCVVATGGGILVGVLGCGGLRLPAQADHRPAAGQRAVADRAVRGGRSPPRQIHASGVVAVVVTGLGIGHKMPLLLSAASRLQIGAFWRLVQFLLEGLVFLLVGLQLPRCCGISTSRSARWSGSPRRCWPPSS